MDFVKIDDSKLLKESIAIKHLEDAYFLFDSDRYDLAFSLLWPWINNLYNQLFCKQPSIEHINEIKAIDYFIDEILVFQNTKDINVAKYFKDFYEKFPKKQWNFLANSILKSMAIEKAIAIKWLYNMGSIMKIGFLIDPIKDTYGKKYNDIANYYLNDWLVKWDMDKNKEKSRKIAYSLSEKIVNLIKWYNEEFFIDGLKIHDVHLNDEQKIKLLFRWLLYATRNFSSHWNKVSRQKSDYKNTGTIESSLYVFFLAHYFFTILLYILWYIDKKYFYEINDENLKIFQKL